MVLTVVPTLELMADVYRRSPVGGPRSQRFAAYRDLVASRVPVHGYNPMTSAPVVRAIEALLAVGAEERLARLAARVAADTSADLDAEVYFTVAATGAWTDRLATEIDHRLLGRDPGSVLWWVDDPVDVADVEAEIVAQVVRLIVQRDVGAPTTLRAAVDQEGRALARSGRVGARSAAAAEALEILGDDTSRSTAVAFLYGDEAAERLGHPPLGLRRREGYEHAVALARTAATGGER